MTKIEWTHPPGYKGESWNPIVGCSVVSPGCTNCYAMRQAARIEKMGTAPYYRGLTMETKGDPVWTGNVVAAPERTWLAPLKWTKPRCIFVNSMGDLFHESIHDMQIDRVFAITALCQQHIFIVLTKRSWRMREYFDGMPWTRWLPHIEGLWAGQLVGLVSPTDGALPNVWLGVSVEDQARADSRIIDLLATPAHVRLLSIEPLLGPIKLPFYSHEHTWCPICREIVPDSIGAPHETTHGIEIKEPFNPKMHCATLESMIDWVIFGGESGPGARDNDFEVNARAILAQCRAAGVPVFGKQNVKKKPLPPDLDVQEWPYCSHAEYLDTSRPA